VAGRSLQILKGTCDGVQLLTTLREPGFLVTMSGNEPSLSLLLPYSEESLFWPADSVSGWPAAKKKSSLFVVSREYRVSLLWSMWPSSLRPVWAIINGFGAPSKVSLFSLLGPDNVNSSSLSSSSLLRLKQQRKNTKPRMSPTPATLPMTAPTMPPVLMDFEDLFCLDEASLAFGVDDDDEFGSVMVTATVDASCESVGLLVIVDIKVVLSGVDSDELRDD